MPLFKLFADVDSVVEEAEHLEQIFKDGIEAENDDEAYKIVEKKIKELHFGGPYYTLSDQWEDD